MDPLTAMLLLSVAVPEVLGLLGVGARQAGSQTLGDILEPMGLLAQYGSSRGWFGKEKHYPWYETWRHWAPMVGSIGGGAARGAIGAGAKALPTVARGIPSLAYFLGPSFIGGGGETSEQPAQKETAGEKQGGAPVSPEAPSEPGTLSVEQWMRILGAHQAQQARERAAQLNFAAITGHPSQYIEPMKEMFYSLGPISENIYQSSLAGAGYGSPNVWNRLVQPVFPHEQAPPYYPHRNVHELAAEMREKYPPVSPERFRTFVPPESSDIVRATPEERRSYRYTKPRSRMYSRG